MSPELLNTRLTAEKLSLSAYLVLHHVASKPGNVGGIAKVLHGSIQKYSQVIDTLEKNGLIERWRGNGKDKRTVEVRITGIGRKVVERIDAPEPKPQVGSHTLTPEEIDQRTKNLTPEQRALLGCHLPI